MVKTASSGQTSKRLVFKLEAIILNYRLKKSSAYSS